MKNFGLNKTELQHFFMLAVLLLVFVLSLMSLTIAISMTQTGLSATPVVIISLFLVWFGGWLLVDNARLED